MLTLPKQANIMRKIHVQTALLTQRMPRVGFPSSLKVGHGSFIFISTWRFAEFLCVWINGNIFSLCIARRRGNLGQHSINFWGVWREIDLSNHSMIWANVRSDRKMYVSVRQGWGLCDPKRRLALWQKYLTLSSLSCGRPIVSSQHNIKYARHFSQNLKCAVTRYPHKNISMCTFLHVDI